MADTVPLDDCICAIVDRLGRGAIPQVVALCDSIIATLTALKTYLLLVYNFPEMVVKKAAGEALLAVIETTISTISAPMNVFIGQFRSLSDCGPISTFTRKLKQVRNDVLEPLEDAEYQVQQLIATADDQKKQIDAINKTIELFENFRDSLELCGNS